MAVYNKDSRLSEVVMAHPSIIPVINRLGVSLGVGDDSVGAVCAERGIDSAFFISVVNTFLDESYFPSNSRDTFSLEKTIDYLSKTSVYYLRVQLPNIERHFDSLISRSGTDNNLGLLRHFFTDMRHELVECVNYDERLLFPALRNGNVPSDCNRYVNAHTEVEEKLHDLLTFFVVHLQGDYDRNLCMAVVSSVFSLQKDVSQNNRIRNRILLPIIREMEVNGDCVNQ
ncbi:MAG: helix-turn-helix transcriptional regulator [Muribaculaceae bacterium]|jgi:regulator of cell morphogenesis and NO signaling